MKYYPALIGMLAWGCFASLATGQDGAGSLSPDSTRAVPVEGQVGVPAEVKQAILEQFQEDFPGTSLYVSEAGDARITRVWGGTIGHGTDPEDAAEQFRVNYSRMFGVRAEDLLPIGHPADGRYTQPLGWNPETGESKFTLVYYSQYLDGLPVFRSGLRLLTRNEESYPLVWAGSTLRDLGAFRVAETVYDAEAGRRAALEEVPSLLNFTDPEAVIWAGTADTVEAPVTALTFTADNDGSPWGEPPEKWLFVTDAATGAILYRENRILFTDVTGSVSGMATTGPKSDNCAPEASMVMKYAKVSIDSTTTYADASGNFTIPNEGASPVTVTSYMSGWCFTVDNVAGPEETLTFSVTPPEPAVFVHNLENTSEAIRAQVNGYVQANVVRDFCLTYNPYYPTIASQAFFPVYVNRTDGHCPGNAWYDGFSINFCSSSSPHPNTAWSNIIHHEYGHHMVESGGSGQSAYGEGMSDSVAMLIADDPICGYGFNGDCNAGIRSADNTMQYPCSGEIHYCGQLLSGCIWSTRNELAVTNPGSYLSIISNLTVDSILLHTGGAITPQIYIDFLTLNDNDGNLNNGTPHYTEITAGFSAHNMAPAEPANNHCGNAAAVVENQAYSGGTAGATVDGSATCGESNNTPDVWYEYTAPENGSLTVNTCADATFDTVLSVHSGCPGTTINQLNCNDNACAVDRSSVSVSVEAGLTYYIRVSGRNGATGTFTLFVSDAVDSAPPIPNPMSFETAPFPNGVYPTTIIDMVATTAIDLTTPIQYAFEANTGPAYPGADSRGWGMGVTYSDTGLTPNTTYVYRTKARDGLLLETSVSPDFSATTHIETPTGISFGTVTTSSIALEVTSALTNLTLGQSGVYFDETGDTGDTGLNEWVQTITDTATSLTPDTHYTFRVRARNQNAVQTVYSDTASKRTLAEVPAAPMLSDATQTTLNLNVNPNGNPATTVFAVRCTGTSPADAYWNDRYVSIAGGPSAMEVWQTDAAWGTIMVGGLQPNTAYTFAVQARNGDGLETAFGSGASQVTLPMPTGACCHPTTGACTIETEGSCTDGDRVYQGDDTTCTPNPCPQPSGACCFTNGTCTVVTQASCTGSSGTYQGDWTDCDPNPCPQPTGACCDASTGACTVETLISCTGGGRIYQGDFTTCTPNPCEQPCLLLGDLNVDGVVNGLDIAGFARAKLGETPLPGENPACADYGGDLNSDIADFVADLLG